MEKKAKQNTSQTCCNCYLNYVVDVVTIVNFHFHILHRLLEEKNNTTVKHTMRLAVIIRNNKHHITF